MRNLHQRRDQGAVLPIVLIIVVVLGVVVGAIAQYATTSLSYARVTEERAYRLTASDSALRNAVDQIRAGAAECLFTGLPVDLPATATQFNGVSASVTCSSLNGGLDAQQLWAVVVTGEGLTAAQDLLTTSGGSNDKTIEGRVWISRVDASALSIGASHVVEILNGPLVYFDSTNPCTSIPAASLAGDIVFTPSIIHRPICTTVPWTDQPSFDDTPISTDIPAMLGNPAFLNPPADTTTYPSCQVFSPGIYTTMPVVTSDTYFQTGDYYLETILPAANTLDFQNVNARAGAINPMIGTVPEIDMSASPCAPAITADSGGAGGRYGATFYLGGDSRIAVDNNASLEIMPRGQFGVDTTEAGSVSRGAYVSIQSICDPLAHVDLSGDSWCDTADLTDTPVVGLLASSLPPFVPASGPGSDADIVYTAAGANKELVTHGLIYVPTGQVRFANAAAPMTDVRILGGVASARLDIQVEPSATNFRIGVDTLPIDVDLLLTSTATLDGNTTDMQAVVIYEPTEPVATRIDVENWRVCAQSGC